MLSSQEYNQAQRISNYVKNHSLKEKICGFKTLYHVFPISNLPM